MSYQLSWFIILLFSTAFQAAFAATEMSLADAAERKDMRAVRALLRQGVSVDAPQPDGATALAWAAHWDDLETADLLLQAGADANAANDYGVTPLMLACTNGSPAMVRKLLQAGALPNTALTSGRTPLMTAARTGNVDVVKSLLEHGARVDHAGPQGQTALMWAAAQKNSQVVRTLIELGADVQARSEGGFTPLLFAARSGDIDSARVLLAAGADARLTTADGMTPLLLAAASGHEALSIFLLRNGADPNAADSSGITPLHYALQKGNTVLAAVQFVPVAAHMFRPSMEELAKALLERGADPNARITRQVPESPLAVSPRAGMVGATPFLLATVAGDVDMMRLLLASGADPTLTTEEKVTPLMIAAGMGRLQDRNPEESKRALEAVEFLLELGTDLNATNAYGRTALHGAASAGEDRIIEFLVGKGAEVNVADRYGQTPWSLAEGILPPHTQDADLPRVLRSDRRNPPHKSTAGLLLKLGAVPFDKP